MSPFPVRLRDRWRDRVEPAFGRGSLYWHVLLGCEAKVRAIGRQGQRRLDGFPEFHSVPLQWLHLTVMEVGSASEIGVERVATMVERTRRALAGWSPATVRLGRVLYHPEAIMLGVEPSAALDTFQTAVRTATAAALDEGFARVDQEWVPHVTLVYSTAAQPAGPVIAALGRRLPECEVAIRSVTLVEQRGPERDWDWHPLATVDAIDGEAAY